jgi:hypothetical protein
MVRELPIPGTETILVSLKKTRGKDNTDSRVF